MAFRASSGRRTSEIEQACELEGREIDADAVIDVDAPRTLFRGEFTGGGERYDAVAAPPIKWLIDQKTIEIGAGEGRFSTSRNLPANSSSSCTLEAACAAAVSSPRLRASEAAAVSRRMSGST